MPFINSTTTAKVNEQQREVIKAELGKIISEIPGKSEEWLMIGFKDENTLYFRGVKMDKAAFIEIKIFGTADRKSKQVLTRKVSSLIERELLIPQDNIYITIDEIKDWGWNGEMF